MNAYPAAPWGIGLDTTDERAQVIAASGEHICYVEVYPVMPTALVLAAAPTMADALREVLNAYSMDDDAMDFAIGVAREALAKAGL